MEIIWEDCEMGKFLDDLLAGGPGYVVERTEGGASVKPISRSDADLIAFQPVADRVVRNNGDGYSIYNELRSSDHAVPYYLIFVLTIESE